MQNGGQRYLDESGPTVTRVLGWILAVVAYVALLTDRLPDRDGPAIRFQVERSGPPTVSSVLLRILYVIPNLILFAILAFFGGIIWLIAAVLVLIKGTYPEGMWRFLLGLVRWEAWLLAYLASLVDHYPPFTLETGPLSPAAPTS